MTAVSYTDFRLWCDVTLCMNRFGPMEKPRAQVRELAVRAGWTHVRSGLGRKYDRDLCPAHRPEAKPQESAR
jgi:hypothetical protein